MPIDVLMPALSPTMEEGTLAKWHVKKGDTVKSGDVIAEIETDKATMEVEAVDEGVVEDILVAEGSELIPLDGMRKTVARRMTDSFRDVPHFPLTIDIELDELLAARAKINAMLEKQGVKVSVNDMVLKAAAVALMRVPEANASYTPEGIAMHHHVALDDRSTTARQAS